MEGLENWGKDWHRTFYAFEVSNVGIPVCSVHLLAVKQGGLWGGHGINPFWKETQQWIVLSLETLKSYKSKVFMTWLGPKRHKQHPGFMKIPYIYFQCSQPVKQPLWFIVFFWHCWHWESVCTTAHYLWIVLELTESLRRLVWFHVDFQHVKLYCEVHGPVSMSMALERCQSPVPEPV